jgi:hypothetical protein
MTRKYEPGISQRGRSPWTVQGKLLNVFDVDVSHDVDIHTQSCPLSAAYGLPLPHASSSSLNVLPVSHRKSFAPLILFTPTQTAVTPITPITLSTSAHTTSNSSFVSMEAKSPHAFWQTRRQSCGEFHDQGDARWIVIREQLWGQNDTLCGRPTPGRPIGRLGVGRLQGVFGVLETIN